MTVRPTWSRGKRLDSGQWVYGAYHKHLRNTPNPIGARPISESDYDHLIVFSGFSDWNMPKPLCYHEVDPNTVGEYTGITNKYGVDVYEGDILESGTRKCIYRVAYDEEKMGWMLQCLNTSWKGYWVKPIPVVVFHDKVIANIYDNPEYRMPEFDDHI